MISNLKYQLSTVVKNWRGFKTKRKFVIFESDDWGSIRMPSVEAFERLSKKGLKFDSPGGYLFNRYDTLAGPDDLSALFEVLNSVRDKNNNPAKFTVLTCVCNPDFERIRNNGFEDYYYEPFNETLKRYYPGTDVWSLWKEGMDKNFFYTESHSREHLNTIRWMENLRQGDFQTLLAFDEGCWSFDRSNAIGYQIAFSISNSSDIEQHQGIIKEGLDIFKNIFGRRALFFVPPNGILHPRLESTLNKENIKYIYSAFKQGIPDDNGNISYQYNYLGKQNMFGQSYIIRNCVYEPNMPNVDWVGVALKQIDTAFKWGKPAILGPHRKNFIGQHDEANRRESLASLKSLLQKIVVKWPDVEFITSTELGKMMDE